MTPSVRKLTLTRPHYLFGRLDNCSFIALAWGLWYRRPLNKIILRGENNHFFEVTGCTNLKNSILDIMKTNIIFSIVFLGGILLAAQELLAQPSSKTEQRLIHINGQGEVLDDRGTKLGYISKEDVVFNAQGQKLGFIKGGEVFDANSKSLGKAKKDGRYYNNDGVFILNTKGIDDTCEILDPEGHKKGTVHKNYKLHACATHCFFLEQEMKKEEDK